MKSKITVILLLICALVQLSGCSIARYDTGDLSKNPEVSQYEFNSIEDFEKIFSNVTTEHIPDTNKIAISWSGIRLDINDIELGADKTFSVKYHRSLIYSAPNVSIPVEFPTGRKYIAYLDTGSDIIVLTSDVILENKLSVHPNYGVCYISELTVGSAQIKDAVAQYDQQQWQFRILNIPLYKHSAIILGINFISSFDYVMFDNVNQKAVFSKEGAFEPDNLWLWSSYPFEIKLDSVQNDRIMVQMSISGQMYELFFDTCGGKRGLKLNLDDWEAISKDLTVKNIRDTHYYNIQAGRLPCKMARVSQLSIADRTLKNIDIQISDDPDGLSVLSLGYFQDTAVVLDFVNNLMWIRKD